MNKMSYEEFKKDYLTNKYLAHKNEEQIKKAYDRYVKRFDIFKKVKEQEDKILKTK